MKIIGIIGAMDEEIYLIKEKMIQEDEISFAGMDFYKGNLNNQKIILVRSGIGKVNAAICAQILISNFNVSAIINTGVAGALYDELNVGDIVISSDVIEHDFDVTRFGDYELGQIPRMNRYIFEANQGLIRAAEEVSSHINCDCRVVVGRILSGDVFVACLEKKSFLWNEFKGYCTEMEGAAIGHTCYINNIPFLIIRSISDKADGTAHVNFKEFIDKAVKNSVQMVSGILKQLN